MKMIDPTYLRTIHDGLLSGAIHKDNASTLPIGLIGIYEEALPPASNLNERKKFLDFFAFWALLKKEVSIAFVVPLLEGWTEENVLDYISQYSKWFNSPVSGKYVLYHERIRSFLLQKISQGHFTACNEAIIQNCQTALQAKSGDEQEYYALEHLSLHLLIQAMKSGDAKALKALAYDTAHWNRQVEISKGFEWSKRMLNDMMLWASKYDDEEVIECSLNKVDLHHQEQNDAPRIVELVAHNEVETALRRIESYGGNDEEGLQRKFILYMLCQMELTLLDSKDKPFRKDAIEKLLKHLDENLPVDHSVLNWNDFFPSYLMFQMACEWAEMGLDYLILYKRTNDWESNWILEKGPYSDLQFEALIKCSQRISNDRKKISTLNEISNELRIQKKIEESDTFIKEAIAIAHVISDEEEKTSSLEDISIKLAKLGKLEEALKCSQGVSDEKDKSEVLKNISTELAKLGKVEEALEIALEISDKDNKGYVLKNISSELAKKGKLEEALDCARGISVMANKSLALLEISASLYKKGMVIKASELIQESLNVANTIDTGKAKCSVLLSISSEQERQGNENDSKTIIQVAFDYEKVVSVERWKQIIRNLAEEQASQGRFEIALKCIERIKNIGVKGDTLLSISISMHKARRTEGALLLLKKVIECAEDVNDINKKCNLLIGVAIELARHERIDESEGLLKKVIELAHRLFDKTEKTFIIKSILSEKTKNGKLRDVNTILIELISSSKENNSHRFIGENLKEISLELIKNERPIEARFCVMGIPDKTQMNFALVGNSIQLVKQGKFEESIRFANSITDEMDKNSALNQITTLMTEQGKLEDAFECTKGISDDSDKSAALLLISTSLAKKGQIEEAHECALGISNEWEKSIALKDISTELAKNGKLEEALDCARGITVMANKSLALLEISATQYKKGMVIEASELIQEAFNVANTIDTGKAKCSVLLSISSEQERQGNENDSKTIIQVAFDYEKVVSIDRWKQILINLAEEQASQGRFEIAIKCIERIKNIGVKGDTLLSTSISMHKFGRSEGALLLLKKAIECAEDAKDIYKKCNLMIDVAIELAKHGKLEAAASMIKEAFECAHVIPDESDKSRTLKKISVEFSNQGAWHLAERTGLEIPQITERQNCWKEFAKNNYEETGWQNALQQVNKFQNAEVKTYYLKSFADSIASYDCSKELINNTISYYQNDIESMEKLLKKYALHELFFSDARSEVIQRFNQSLNIEWAIDILTKNSNEN